MWLARSLSRTGLIPKGLLVCRMDASLIVEMQHALGKIRKAGNLYTSSTLGGLTQNNLVGRAAVAVKSSRPHILSNVNSAAGLPSLLEETLCHSTMVTWVLYLISKRASEKTEKRNHL